MPALFRQVYNQTMKSAADKVKQTTVSNKKPQEGLTIEQIRKKYKLHREGKGPQLTPKEMELLDAANTRKGKLYKSIMYPKKK